MKYTKANPPIACMLTDSTCYKGTRRDFVPKGILWHSTGSNNPSVKRYVQPADNAPDRDEMLKLLGVNQYGNDWNHIYRECGMHFFIGKLADGSVSAIQTMPLNFRPWGCASGSKGSGNDLYVQFEICEDNLTDKTYFDKVYREACEITAYVCSLYGLDPHGTIAYKGQNVPVIIDHWTSYKLGIGSGHADLTGSKANRAWFQYQNKTLDDVRNDVAKILAGEGIPSVVTKLGDRVLKNGMRGDDVKELQERLNALGYNCGTADGIFGSKTESAVKAFQKDNYLQIDGIFGAKSLDALLHGSPSQPPEEDAPVVDIDLPKLSKGMDDRETAGTVAYLQSRLNEKGYGLTVDGDFGKNTESAVKDWQKKMGIPVTGVVTNPTWKSLEV